ncbi:hypothetical protein B8281_15975 [Cellulosimicrobium sp. TH-20]|uniref:hypothetical protein n=1 Tax=Cellulosimicrobium sp. TH-20 TaxID=1980001 RepID=UPI000A17DD4A|nr:hypothetical protein [Cellulosimicrobium sp. TH-20]ARK05990.1 hypothetical protein B8281_15975 [Cellulosimicrobium sp. TH-20]
MIVTVVVMAIAVAWLSRTVGASAASQVQNQQQSGISGALKQMSREIGAADPLLLAEPSQVITQTVRDGECVGFRYLLTGAGDQRSLITQSMGSGEPTCDDGPIPSDPTSWPAPPTPNPEGNAVSNGSSTVLVNRVAPDSDGVPLFGYYTADQEVWDPAAGPQAIARVDMVITAYTVRDGYVTLTTTAVPRNGTPGSGVVEELPPPRCPSVTSSVAGGAVALSWTPIDGATQYTIVRTQGNSVTLNQTIPATDSPSWTDSQTIESLPGVLTYTVSAITPSGASAACTPVVVSDQLAPPNLQVQVQPGPAPSTTVGAAGWDGNRGGEQPATTPSYVIRWGSGAAGTAPVARASGYQVQMWEINPDSGNEVSGAWRTVPGTEGANTNPNLTSVTVSNIDGVLWNREFKFRVQALGSTGASPWTTVESNSGGYATGQSGKDTANRGIKTYPASPEIAVTTTGNGVNQVSWTAPAPGVTYQLQARIVDANGAQAWADATRTQSLSYTHTGRPAGVWTEYRVRACNAIPYPAATPQSCGPYSRYFRSAQPAQLTASNISVSNNGGWGTNTVSWHLGTAQVADSFDVAVRNTSTGASWSTIWGGTTARQANEGNKRRGDFAQYQYRSYIDASGPREVGGGWSNWSGATAQAWHRPNAPTCSATTTWNSVTLSANTGSVYMNPAAAASWEVRFQGITGASGTTWTDPNPRIDPLTTYSGVARAGNQAGWSEWGPDCAPTTPAPPIPGLPAFGAGATFGQAQPGNDIDYMSIAGIQVNFGVSEAATRYDVGWRYRFLDSGGWSGWNPSSSPGAMAGDTAIVGGCVFSSSEGVGSPQVRVRGVNLTGAGPWRTYDARAVPSPGCW